MIAWAMSESATKWTAAAGAVAAIVTAAVAIGSLMGKLDLVVEWSHSAEKKLINLEASDARQDQLLSDMRSILMTVTERQLDMAAQLGRTKGRMTPIPDHYPQTPWRGQPEIGP